MFSTNTALIFSRWICLMSCATSLALGSASVETPWGARNLTWYCAAK